MNYPSRRLQKGRQEAQPCRRYDSEGQDEWGQFGTLAATDL